MGGGTYSTDTHAARSAARVQSHGSTFTHHVDIQQGKKQAEVHESLDPNLTNKNGPHTDKNIRECMISDDHPNPTGIVVLFDVTGSMGTIPAALQKKLGLLHGLLQRKGYVEDPQILFGAIGDARSDKVPLQVGQFESDNRMDDNLAMIYLEGNGGGHGTESYALAVYWAAFYTYLEKFEREGEKGFLFTIGDERPGRSLFDTLQPSHHGHSLKSLIGDDRGEDMSWEDIKAAVEVQYEWFHLVVTHGGRLNGGTLSEWRKILGERAIELDDHEAVCELIAMTIGIIEGTTTLDDGMQDLKDAGFDTTKIQSASKALIPVAAGTGATGNAVVVADEDLPDTNNDDGGADRL